MKQKVKTDLPLMKKLMYAPFRRPKPYKKLHMSLKIPHFLRTHTNYQTTKTNGNSARFPKAPEHSFGVCLCLQRSHVVYLITAWKHIPFGLVFACGLLNYSLAIIYSDIGALAYTPSVPYIRYIWMKCVIIV